MKRLTKPKHSCRGCPFCGPSGECLDPTPKSGRCGDWVWYFRNGKQCRRRYAFPRDPRTPAQLCCRARLGVVSKAYSYSVTPEQRAACIAAGAKVQSQPRLAQSGPLTGQQYWVRREFAGENAESEVTKAKSAPKVAQKHGITRSTWGIHRSIAGVAPGQRRLGTGRARNGGGGRKKVECRRKKEQRSPQVFQNQEFTRSAGGRHRSNPRATRWRAAEPSRKAIAPPGRVWYTPCVTRNTITIRLRRPKAEIEAKAKPNLNAWVNQLIEQALGPRRADWNEHFDRPSSGRKFRYSAQVKRAER